MFPRPLRRIELALAAALLLAGAQSGQAQDEPSETRDARPAVALMGTIPIYWGEAAGLAEILEGDKHAHWARGVMEGDFRLAPLDFLTEETLADHDFLLMAQPRALAPSENVALDAWVRGGGRLLLFADPMMTGESRFSFGDRRRAQDVTLLSPLLAHWGLEMLFDEEQSAQLQMRDFAGQRLPVNLPGQFRSLSAGECVIRAEGLAAACRPGEGFALILADAAMLDFAGPWPEAEEGLGMLIDEAFARNGDGAGNGGEALGQGAENHAIPTVSPAGEEGGPGPPLP